MQKRVSRSKQKVESMQPKVQEVLKSFLVVEWAGQRREGEAQKL